MEVTKRCPKCENVFDVRAIVNRTGEQDITYCPFCGADMTKYAIDIGYHDQMEIWKVLRQVFPNHRIYIAEPNRERL